jgi:hypothetical protein
MKHTPGTGAAAAELDPDSATTAAQAFIAKWSGITASELATAQSFVIELCALLGVAPPSHEPHYQFERPITFRHGGGSSSAGRVDCYKRGHFVWESKKLKAGMAAQASGGAPTKAFDDALLKARQQAEDCARALPAAEGCPPFCVGAGCWLDFKYSFKTPSAFSGFAESILKQDCHAPRQNRSFRPQTIPICFAARR